MESITSFFSYLFNLNPGPTFRYYIPLLVLSGLLIIFSLIFSMIYKNKKKTDFVFKRLFRKVSSVSVIFSLLILFLVAVRYENIPYFSMRFLLYITLLLILYFIYRYLKIFKVDYVKEKSNVDHLLKNKEKEEKTYLPNKKKK